MAMTPDEIENHVFSLVRRGYDPAEVDDFLKEVAAALAQAQLGVIPPGAAAAGATDDQEATAISDADDFGRLGEEVAAILRQAHESVTTLRHRAEADAALLRQDAEQEAALLREEADTDRQAAAIELEAARTESARVLGDIQRQADQATEAAAALAARRTREIVEAARREAQGAVTVQRNVRGRLEGTREDIDQALDHLVEEDEDLFETIDLTDTAPAAAATARGDAPAGGPGLVPPPGQGPPTPPVPPPPRTTPLDIEDLPYDEDDDELVEGEEPPERPAVDLTDGGDESPPDVPGDGGTGEAAAEPSGPDRGRSDDPLGQMVRNAVENALKRRKGDGEPPDGDDA